LEPRLAKKLQEPLTDVITTTPAKSLLYECVNTLLCGEIKSKTTVRLCLDKLTSFIEDSDQNLKYLGLLGLHKLMKAHPKIVAEHKDLILGCLRDEDVTIKMRALDLITSLASQRNLQGIVKKLMEHLEISEANYREHVLGRIIDICSQDNYAYIADFEWYIEILVNLTLLQGISRENALKITEQLLDVTIRVPAVRKHAVNSMAAMLISGRLFNSNAGEMNQVLYSAAFIVGEFAEYLGTQHAELITILTAAELISMPNNVQNVFIQAVIKIFASALLQPFDQVADYDNNIESSAEKEEQKLNQSAADDENDAVEEEADLDSNGVKRRKVHAVRRSFNEWFSFIAGLLEVLYQNLPLFTQSNSVEVQERSVSYKEFVHWLIFHGQFNTAMKIRVQNAEKSKTAEEKQNEAAVFITLSPEPAQHKQLNLLNFDPLSEQNSSQHTTNAEKSPQSAAAAATAAAATLPQPQASPSSPVRNTTLPKDKYTSLAIQLNLLFAERLNPVNPKAQKKVPLPKGLDLDQVVNNEPDSDLSDSEDTAHSEEEDRTKKKTKGKAEKVEKTKKKPKKEEEENWENPLPMSEVERAQVAVRRKAREAAQQNDPFYIKDKKSASASTSLLVSGASANEIPLRQLSADDLPPITVEESKEKKRERKKARAAAQEEEDEIFNPKAKANAKVFKVMKTQDLPDSDEEKGKKHGKSSRKAGAGAAEGSSDDESALDKVDLTKPLGPNEVIPKAKSYNESKNSGREEEKPKKEKKAKKDKEDGGEKGGDEKRKKEKKEKKDRKDKDREKDKKENKDKKEKKKDKVKEKEKGGESASAPRTTAAPPSKPTTASVLDLFDPMNQ
jgi:hypothetical protein